jgi:hypothetical protein
MEPSGLLLGCLIVLQVLERIPLCLGFAHVTVGWAKRHSDRLLPIDPPHKALRRMRAAPTIFTQGK